MITDEQAAQWRAELVYAGSKWGAVLLRLLDERDALRAELERARAVVEAAREFEGARQSSDDRRMFPAAERLIDALAAYDAAQDAPAQDARP